MIKISVDNFIMFLDWILKNNVKRIGLCLYILIVIFGDLLFDLMGVMFVKCFLFWVCLYDEGRRI